MHSLSNFCYINRNVGNGHTDAVLMVVNSIHVKGKLQRDQYIRTHHKLVAHSALRLVLCNSEEVDDVAVP
jgi:hypothetical protein